MPKPAPFAARKRQLIEALKYAAACLGLFTLACAITDSIAVFLSLVAGVFLMAAIDEICDGRDGQ
jgi:hypothetical protein